MTDLETRKLGLRQKQSLPLEGKVILAQQRIREWYDHWDGQVYISFSGGKDSTVLMHLVKDMYPDVPVVFVDTGLEYPEVRRFATEHADVVLRPEMRFDQVIKTYGYPVIGKEVAQTIFEARKNVETGKYTYRLKKLNGALVDKDGNPSRYNIPQHKYLLDAPFAISHKCCDVMKKRPVKKYEKETGRKAIIGTMAAESFLRKSTYLQEGCNAFDNVRPISKPLSVWLEQDILQYIKQNGLEIASVYGDIVERDQLQGQMRMFPDQWDELATTGVSRTGCMFCMFGAQCEKAPNRFQRMKETHPRQYAYCMRPVEEGGLGLKEVLEYIGVPYE